MSSSKKRPRKKPTGLSLSKLVDILTKTKVHKSQRPRWDNVPSRFPERFDRTYRVPGVYIFFKKFDHDENMILLRKKFCTEMFFLTGNHYPDPKIALSLHEVFIAKLSEALESKVTETAKELQDNLEHVFKSRFLMRGESLEDFYEWDRIKMNSFFANRVFEERIKRVKGVLIHDDFIDAQVNLPNIENQFSLVVRVSESSDITTLSDSDPMIVVFSPQIHESVRNGYSFDEIVETIVRRSLSFDLLMAASNIKPIGDDNICEIGLSDGVSPDEIGKQRGTWAQLAMCSLLNGLANPRNGFLHEFETAVMMLALSSDRKQTELIFQAMFGDDSTMGDKLELIIYPLHRFIERLYGKDLPEASKILKELATNSVNSEADFLVFQKALDALCGLDERTGRIIFNVICDINGTNSGLIFENPPVDVQASSTPAFQLRLG